MTSPQEPSDSPSPTTSNPGSPSGRKGKPAVKARKISPAERYKRALDKLPKLLEQVLIPGLKANMRAGLPYPGRTNSIKRKTGFDPFPPPANPKEAAKYAEIREVANKQFLDLLLGTKRRGPAKAFGKGKTAVSFDDLCRMEPQKRQEILREMVEEGVYKKDEAREILQRTYIRAETIHEEDLGREVVEGGFAGTSTKLRSVGTGFDADQSGPDLDDEEPAEVPEGEVPA